MQKLLLGTNFKMYKGIKETSEYLHKLSRLTQEIRGDVTLFVIPSFIALPNAVRICRGKDILVGAQNMHFEEFGQYTGEISPLMLDEIGVDLIEIGHSERRAIFNETDEEENAKVKAALEHGFIALLCVGETAKQKTWGISDETLRMQIKIGLSGVNSDDIDRVWIAYEPVWAIGVNGVTADPEYVFEKHKVIKDVLIELFPKAQIPVLYGGSVNNDNANALISLPNVDGLFIGRSAWDAENFNEIIRVVLQVWKRK